MSEHMHHKYYSLLKMTFPILLSMRMHNNNNNNIHWHACMSVSGTTCIKDQEHLMAVTKRIKKELTLHNQRKFFCRYIQTLK